MTPSDNPWIPPAFAKRLKKAQRRLRKAEKGSEVASKEVSVEERPRGRSILTEAKRAFFTW
jgi:hypothetical protein